MAKVSLREQLAPFLVSNKEGVVDLVASTAKFGDACLTYFAQQEANDVLIKEALTSVFDQRKGSYLSSGALTMLTIQRLQAAKPELNDPNLFGMLSSRIDYVLHLDLGARESGKTYGVKRGIGGGFVRWADLPAVTEETK